MNSIKIKGRKDNPSFIGTIIEVNGVSLPLIDCRLRGDVGGIWIAECSFYVLPQDVNFYGELKLEPRMDIFSADAKRAIYETLKKEFEPLSSIELKKETVPSKKRIWFGNTGIYKEVENNEE